MTETEPYYLDKRKDLRFKRHPGQRRAMQSRARFILVLAGTQSGKSVLGPWWMLREICLCGPGDYLVVAPSYPLMQLKLLTEYRRLFETRLGFGEYKVADRVFVFNQRGEESCFNARQETPTQVFFGHAQDPDSLESATAKAAHLDEAGQKKFRLGSWEAVQRRLSIHQGRVLITTTPYVLGWLKNDVHDRAKRKEPGYDLVQFESIMNPAFSREEYERARAVLPTWKFNMMYRGLFERPAGMIYDVFTDERKVPRFDIPRTWKRYLGLDFGGVNTAGVFIAEDPLGGKWYAYRTYHAGGRTAKEHADELKKGEPVIHMTFGGSSSEGQWRQEFAAAGLTVHRPPVSDVEIGIGRVYAAFKTGRLHVFDDLTDIIDELESYSREVDETGEPTEKIEDKETYHRADSLRYIMAHLNPVVTDQKYTIAKN